MLQKSLQKQGACFDNAAKIYALQKQGACLGNAAKIYALQKQETKSKEQQLFS